MVGPAQPTRSAKRLLVIAITGNEALLGNHGLFSSDRLHGMCQSRHWIEHGTMGTAVYFYIPGG